MKTLRFRIAYYFGSDFDDTINFPSNFKICEWSRITDNQRTYVGYCDVPTDEEVDNQRILLRSRGSNLVIKDKILFYIYDAVLYPEYEESLTNKDTVEKEVTELLEGKYFYSVTKNMELLSIMRATGKLLGNQELQVEVTEVCFAFPIKVNEDWSMCVKGVRFFDLDTSHMIINTSFTEDEDIINLYNKRISEIEKKFCHSSLEVNEESEKLTWDGILRKWYKPDVIRAIELSRKG